MEIALIIAWMGDPLKGKREGKERLYGKTAQQKASPEDCPNLDRPSFRKSAPCGIRLCTAGFCAVFMRPHWFRNAPAWGCAPPAAGGRGKRGIPARPLTPSLYNMEKEKEITPCPEKLYGIFYEMGERANGEKNICGLSCVPIFLLIQYESMSTHAFADFASVLSEKFHVYIRESGCRGGSRQR